MSTEKTIEERLKELEALAEKASPGPWDACRDEFVGWTVNSASWEVGLIGQHDAAPPDAAFIAAAREAVPWLISELRRLRLIGALGANDVQHRRELTAWREDSDNARYCEKCGRLHGPGPKTGFNKRGGICDG